MKKITGYLTNYTAPSAGFSEGQLKDDPGDASGSGITVLTHNDFLYGFIASIIKYKGALSDTAESETASDIMDSAERMAGVQNENVNEWANGTTYAADEHAMYLGLQFVSMVAGNVGNNPIDTPAKWLPCFNRDDAMVKWRNGEDVKCGFEAIHDYRDVLYRPIFLWGKYNYGGDAGRNFQATGLHLDGDVVTGDATLVALLDVGGVDEYHLLDIIAPDVLGTRTLLDTRGRVAACVDGIGGNRAIVGTSQNDTFQGHLIGADVTGIDVLAGGLSVAALTYTGSSQSFALHVGNQALITNGVHGAPRQGPESQMKNYSVGIAAIMIMQEI